MAPLADVQMTTDRKKLGVGFWFAVVSTTLALTVLSFGPATWLFDRGILRNRSAIEFAYYPIGYELRGTRPIQRAIHWYERLAV